jgi:para-nitrobenzyl esterase
VLQLRTLEASRQATDEVLELLGVGADVDALQALDAEKLVEASLSLMGQGTVALTRRGFDPALGPSLPRHPVDAVRAGSAAGVNVVLGCTTHEMASFMPADVWGADDDATRERAALMGEGAEHRLEAYRRIRPDEPLASLLVLMISDLAFRIPHVRYADALIEGGGEAPWVYLYGYMQPGPDGIPRSGHGGDTPYFFNNVDKAPVMAGPQAGPLTAITSGALVALARTGNPNHPAIPAWPRYSPTRRPTMVFDVEPRVEDDPMSAEREIWDRTEVPDLE